MRVSLTQLVQAFLGILHNYPDTIFVFFHLCELPGQCMCDFLGRGKLFPKLVERSLVDFPLRLKDSDVACCLAHFAMQELDLLGETVLHILQLFPFLPEST